MDDRANEEVFGMGDERQKDSQAQTRKKLGWKRVWSCARFKKIKKKVWKGGRDSSGNSSCVKWGVFDRQEQHTRRKRTHHHAIPHHITSSPTQRGDYAFRAITHHSRKPHTHWPVDREIPTPSEARSQRPMLSDRHSNNIHGDIHELPKPDIRRHFGFF